jgi:putative addiction module component (TIGR02574 family)
MTTAKLAKETLSLPPKSRAKLAETLLASLDDSKQRENDALWAEEAENRLDAFEQGKLHAIPGPEVFKKLVTALRSLQPQLLRIEAEARGLAQLYLKAGILPPRFSDDALHVAVAVCHRMDVIVSWNMKHLANMRRAEQINRLNLKYDLPSIRIHTPAEVIES